MVKAVLFDLYETLVTEHESDWQDPHVWERLGLDRDDAKREWRSLRRARMSGQVAGYPAVLREICLRLGVPPDEKVIEVLYRERLEQKAVPFQSIDQSVLSTIRLLQSDGLNIAVVSNAAVEEVVAWGASPLSDLIGETVFSFRVGCMKPDPEIYAIACQRVGVLPDEAIFVGDGGSHELTGAKAAGLIPVWATWFLERWSDLRTEQVDPLAKTCLRCRSPQDLLELVGNHRG